MSSSHLSRRRKCCRSWMWRFAKIFMSDCFRWKDSMVALSAGCQGYGMQCLITSLAIFGTQVFLLKNGNVGLEISLFLLMVLPGPRCRKSRVQSMVWSLKERASGRLAEVVPWQIYLEGVVGLEMLGDNKFVVDWLNGLSSVGSGFYSEQNSKAIKLIRRVLQLMWIAPRQNSTNSFRHIYREFNGGVDIPRLPNIRREIRSCVAWLAATTTCVVAIFWCREAW